MGKLIATLIATTVVALPMASAETDGDPPPERMLGIGYKIGNGIGFIGADVLIAPLPRLSVDLHAAWIPDFDSAFALAPAVQFHLWPGSTPYAAAGIQYVRATLGDVTASGNGFFANIGYEWRWSSGLGIQLGGGVQYLQQVTATDGTETVQIGGEVNPNIEFGVRYRFL